MSGLNATTLLLSALAVAGDYSQVPIPSKRVYGRVRDQLLNPSSIELKKLSQLKTKDASGRIVDSAQVYALIFRGSDGQGIVAYFTTPEDSLAVPIGFRQPAVMRNSPEHRKMMYPGGRKVPIGVTSAQMTFLNPKTGRLETKVYRDRVAAQLSLIPTRGTLVGQLLLVLPDMNRSFVCGAFKVPK